MSLGQRRPNVRGHIIRALQRVPVSRIPLRRQAVEKIGEVRGDVRIVILLNQQRRRSVLHKHRQEPDAQFRPKKPLRNRISE